MRVRGKSREAGGREGGIHFLFLRTNGGLENKYIDPYDYDSDIPDLGTRLVPTKYQSPPIGGRNECWPASAPPHILILFLLMY